MSTKHKVRRGEHLARLAYQHGHRSVFDIWDHEANAGLRERRLDPGVLRIGDEIEIPTAEPFEFHGLAVGRRHVIEVDLPYPSVRVQFAFANELPIVGPDVVVRAEFDGETVEVATDAEGIFEVELFPETENVSFTTLGRKLACTFSTLQPVDTFAGIHDRLANLGYDPGGRTARRPRDGVAFLSAVQEFQCDHGLKIDGDPGDDTQLKLLEIAGA